MKLLIVTQAVDAEHPVLGFFHRWIEEFAKHAEKVTVICLTEGAHTLPKNVSVHSLGKESAPRKIMIYHNFSQRARYALRFWRLAWKLRKQYDAVFVHMNQEYVLLGGLFWRALGKRIILWRNHAVGSFWTRTAGTLAHVVCSTSPDSYVARFQNAVRMPIGIDTAQFAPAAATDTRSVLFLGRIDPVKRVDVFVRALEILAKRNIPFSARIIGNPTDEKSDYAHDVRNQASPLALEGVISMQAAVPHATLPLIYQAHGIYVNITQSGSFDKTIGEALASGCIVITGNSAVRGVVPKELFLHTDTPESLAVALEHALGLSAAQRSEITNAGRTYIEQEHSLQLLAERVFSEFAH